MNVRLDALDFSIPARGDKIHVIVGRGDQVVTGGQYRLEPGSAVKPTRTQTSAVSPAQEKAAQ